MPQSTRFYHFSLHVSGKCVGEITWPIEYKIMNTWKLFQMKERRAIHVDIYWPHAYAPRDLFHITDVVFDYNPTYNLSILNITEPQSFDTKLYLNLTPTPKY